MVSYENMTKVFRFEVNVCRFKNDYLSTKGDNIFKTKAIILCFIKCKKKIKLIPVYRQRVGSLALVGSTVHVTSTDIQMAWVDNLVMLSK